MAVPAPALPSYNQDDEDTEVEESQQGDEEEQDLFYSRLTENTKRASYRGEPVSDLVFTLFPDLSPELRLCIWKIAIDVPRIVQFKKRRRYFKVRVGDKFRYYEGPWKFYARDVPALLSVCHEARVECLKAYEGFTKYIKHEVDSDKPLSFDKPHWFRPALDIFYLKDFEFASETGRLGTPSMFTQVDNLEESETRIFESCRWQYPDWFDPNDKDLLLLKQVMTLAVNRDVFLKTMHPGEYVLRSYFPNLKLFLPLIDSSIDIDRVWGIGDGDYDYYESGWENVGAGSAAITRRRFCELSTGPFRIDLSNDGYKSWVEDHILAGLRVEEEEDESYACPVVITTGCHLPATVEPNLPGRLPPDSDYVF